VSQQIDLYDHAYGNDETDVYKQIRIETYGQDFGQTSWVTTEESREIPQLLALTRESWALEVGCGTGGYALQLARTIGCHIIGLDANEGGIRRANRMAQTESPGPNVRFEQRDASKKLPFNERTFDAVFANDVLCHMPGRASVLTEMFRVLKLGGRMLFSDALVIGGIITQEEIVTRSSIGFYVFSPPGENERLLKSSGFSEIRTIDTTEDAARIASRWSQARAKRKKELIAAEGEVNFEGLQRFLSCVTLLTSERRLLRYLYLASKQS
jgi:SAM-dependent methyltransferase